MTKKSRDRRKHIRWLKRQSYQGEIKHITLDEIKKIGFTEHQCNGLIFYFRNLDEFKDNNPNINNLPIIWHYPM